MWHPWAFMTDASRNGFGVVTTRLQEGEVKEEMAFTEAKGWTVPAEEAYSKSEEEETREGDEHGEDSEAQFRAERRPGYLGFAWSGRLALEVRRRGCPGPRRGSWTTARSTTSRTQTT